MPGRRMSRDIPHSSRAVAHTIRACTSDAVGDVGSAEMV
jgi:hypothetical protein